MEATLANDGDVISSAEWTTEVCHVVSFAFSPYNMVTSSRPYTYAFSPSFQRQVDSLLDWVCSIVTSPLAIAALRHASTCARYVTRICTADDEPCCFSMRPTKRQRVQVSFGDIDGATGIMRRSLFYVMQSEMILLVECFYYLGHIGRITSEAVTSIIVADEQWRHVLSWRMDAMRVRINQCMLVLYKFVTSPPCSIVDGGRCRNDDDDGDGDGGGDVVTASRLSST